MKKIFKNFLLFFILAFSFLTFEIVFYLIGFDFNNMTLKTSVVLSVIKEVFFLILLIIIYRKYLVEKWHDFKNKFHDYFDVSFKWWLLGLIIMYISNIILISINNNIGENEEAVQSIITAYPVIAIFMTTFFAPIIEELIFRKSMQDCFNSKNLFAIISGLVFGYIHVMGASSLIEYLFIIPYGALGYSFAQILNKTDNIYATIMIHALHNGILTLIQVIL